ncbi:unnamed protein product [Arctia plantaginis]|uniref:Uncharacterized protein n=1 Tax=Arctia plantaginis TaxID=874455 RepID=A0A8S1AFG2_ARCPL|nr:unnamed protein product [Arctia plantaginis]
MGISDIEKLFGFKNKIKWGASFKIISYHLFGIWWIWHYAFPAKLLTILFLPVMYIISGKGITCGVHRLFTHKCYKVKTPLKIYLLLCYVAAGQVNMNKIND